MPLSSNVRLPLTQRAVFPDRCVRCGNLGPDDTIHVCTNAIGWWTIVLWIFGRRYCVEVPVCYPCGRQMRREKWRERILSWGWAVIGVAIALALFGAYEGPFKIWLIFGVAMLCMTPFFLWETLFPPSIDLTAFSATMDYQFRDNEYANEFADLNGGKVDGNWD